MTPTRARTFAAICGLTFASDRRALAHLLQGEAMTTRTIYVPVLIETAEQAEALPTGTLARHAAGSGMDHAHKIAPIGDPTPLLGWVSLAGLVSNSSMVGWTALVPIEAEEETRNDSGLRGCETEQDFVDYLDGKRVHTMTRLVIPWEEA